MMLSGETEEILLNAARKLDWRDISVRPFKRFGFSGAEIFVISPHGGAGFPHILKVSTKEDISKEIRGLKRAGSLVRGAPWPNKIKSNNGALGGIVYEMYESDSGTDGVLDLNDVYTNCMTGVEIAEDRLIPKLESALLRFDGAHILQHGSKSSQTYRTLFARYQRPNHPSRVTNLFASLDRGLELHGVRIPENPIEPIGTLLNMRTKEFRAGFVHGDLHLSNIVISDALNTANLIDFAWAHKNGHLFLDFAMLESSMRFKGFRRDINPHRLLEIDRELTSAMIGRSCEIAEEEPDPLSRHRLLSMTRAVMLVRSRLCSVMSVQNPLASSEAILREYQRTMYLILSGQEKFDSFPLLRTTLNLHLLRTELGL